MGSAEILHDHWLAILLLVAGLGLAGWMLYVHRQSGRWSLPLLFGSASLLLVGIGGFTFLPEEWNWWGGGITLGLLVLMLLVAIVTGQWSADLGCGVGAVLLFFLGALLVRPVANRLQDAGLFLLSLQPLEPVWLLLLLLVPALIWFSFRNLSGLGPVRRYVALTLRALLIVFLALALAETHARRPDKDLTVLVLWDRSLSIPPEREGDRDLREERLKDFISEAIAKRGPGKEGDKVGLILFGRRPRLELPPASVPQLKLPRNFLSPIDDTYTNIGDAIKLALASFPENTGKRIVLISDGNENMGLSEEQARIAKQNGVEIDIIPVAAGRRNPNEVLVERIEAPPFTERETRLPLRIVLRSFHPQSVVGSLQLSKISLDMIKDQPVFDGVPLFETKVKLKPGLNVFYYQQPGSKKDDAYTYEAKFVPLYVENNRGQVVQKDFPGDRIENNRASVSVMSRGQRAVLLVEPNVGDHQLLADRLRQAKSSMKVVTIDPSRLPQDPMQLAIVLSKFDGIILANIPADALTDEQQKVIRSNTHDQGAGFIMVGGPQSFGAGGWQGTELEKAMPVTSDLKSVKVEGKSGLVLIMHASEIAEGNAWQRKIAKLAIEKLSPMDMIGVLYYDHGFQGAGGHTWFIPFQEIGTKRNALISKLDGMMPGDMPDVDPSLIKSYDELTKPEYALGTKHIIFISDGDHWEASLALLRKIKNAKITCTTVCITSHGQAEIDKMRRMAAVTGGRPWHVKDPSELPSIYIKEARLISQSFVHEKPFQPQLVFRGGPTEGMSNPLDPLHGFVRTTKRSSPLVEVPIQTPKIGDAQFPILAYWQYGLGKSVAFTSDARTQPGGKAYWDRDWANSNIYIKFWEQTVDWSLRSLESGKFLQVNTETRDGKVRVIVEAHEEDSNKTPITDVELKAGISSPSFKGPDGRKIDLKFEQKNAGVYEAEFVAEEVGSYFLTIQAKWRKDGKEIVDAVRTGVTIPYSPEFAEMESNTALLERLREITGGKRYDDDYANLMFAAQNREVFRMAPISHQSMQTLWYWLVFLAGVCFLLDIAVRRIALEPAVAVAYATRVWDRLRRREVAEQTTVFLERLKTKKAEVGELLEKKKAAKRFEAGEVVVGEIVVAGPQAAGTAPKKAEAKKLAPEKKKEEAADFASRLMKAKKKAMEERDKK